MGRGGLYKITPGVHSKVSEGNIFGLFPVSTGSVMFLLQDFLPEFFPGLQYDPRELKETLGLDNSL